MKKFLKKWKGALLIGLGILVLALFLRVYNLTHLPVFADEAIYIRWAQVMRAESTLRFLPLSDGKQPLFMWVVIPFLKVFNDPLFAGRAVSALAGIGTMIGVFTATYLLSKSQKASLAAMTLYAVSPFAVFFDRLSLVDSMLSMFGVWVFIGGLLLVRTLRLDLAMITGFILGGALLTKSPALFFVLLLPLFIILVKAEKAKALYKKATPYLKALGLLGVAAFIGYGMYNILRLGPNFHLLSQRNYDYVYPYSHILTSPLDPFLPFIDRIKEYFIIIGPWPVLFLAVLGVFAYLKEKKELFLLLSWTLFPMVMVSEFSKTMTARYVFFVVPFVMILAGVSLLTKKEWFKKITLFLFLVFLFQSLTVDRLLLTNIEAANLPRSERSGFLEEWTAGIGIKEVAEFVKEKHEVNPEEVIVVGTEGYFGTLPDGLQIYLTDIENVTVIGIGLELDHVPSSLIESKKAGNTTYLVVNNERLFASVEYLGLEIVAVYPKAVRPNGERQTLYLLEVTEKTLQKAVENAR